MTLLFGFSQPLNWRRVLPLLFPSKFNASTRFFVLSITPYQPNCSLLSRCATVTFRGGSTGRLGGSNPPTSYKHLDPLVPSHNFRFMIDVWDVPRLKKRKKKKHEEMEEEGKISPFYILLHSSLITLKTRTNRRDNRSNTTWVQGAACWARFVQSFFFKIAIYCYGI